jgi:hypothetical protein
MLSQVIHNFTEFYLLNGKTVGTNDVLLFIDKGIRSGVPENELAKIIKVKIKDKVVALKAVLQN